MTSSTKDISRLNSHFVPLDKMEPINGCPISIWRIIFGYLNPQTQSQTSLVCRTFYLISGQQIKPEKNAFNLAMQTQNWLKAWKILQHPLFDASCAQNSICYASAYGNLIFVDEVLKNPKVNPSPQHNRSLLLALMREDREILKRLLEDPRTDGNCILIDLAKQGDVEMMTILIDRHKVNLSFLDAALLEACEKGHEGVVKLLLEKTAVDPSKDQQKPLFRATMYGRLGVVNVLLADSRVQPSEKILFVAFQNKHREIVKVLFPLVNIVPTKKGTLLEGACLCGDLDSVKRVHAAYLSYCPSTSPSINYAPSIDAACSVGSIEIAEFLLEQSKGVYKPYNITTACHRGHVHMVRYLLNLPKDKFSRRPHLNDILLEFIKNGIWLLNDDKNKHLEIVQVFLRDKRVDPTVNNHAAIRTASAHGCYKIVRELLSNKKVDPSANDNETIKNLAEKSRGKLMEQLLKDKRVKRKLSASNQLEEFQFYSAAWRGKIQKVNKYLQNPLLDPKQGAIALRFAVRYNQLEVTKTLLQNTHILPDPSFEETWANVLQVAASKGHFEIVQELLQNERAPKEFTSDIWSGYMSSIKSAAATGNIAILDALLTNLTHKGITIRMEGEIRMASESSYYDAVRLACYRHHFSALQKLVNFLPYTRFGVDICFFNEIAEKAGDKEIVTFIKNSVVRSYVSQYVSEDEI